MSIKKQKSGSFKVNVPYPVKFREISGIDSTRFQKTFSTFEEAEKAEKDMKKSIDKVIKNNSARSLELKGNIKFKKFFEEIWWDMYLVGQTSRTKKSPSSATVENTQRIIKNHLLPMFGDFSLNYLNDRLEIVSAKMRKKSMEYANINQIKIYLVQVFDIAEVFGYIEYNRLDKVMNLLTSPKKDELAKEKYHKNKALSAKELNAYLEALSTDLINGDIIFQDYALFMITMILGDRKSESYALQWKHILFKKKCIRLVQAQDRNAAVVPTKGRKKTIFQIPDELYKILLKWRRIQKKELFKMGVKQDEEQFLFTFTNRKGEMNQQVHACYLNRRLEAMERRHPELAHLTPHKLRHTFATLAREAGVTMNDISSALTHSDTEITRTYVNTEDVVGLTVYSGFKKTLDEAKIEA